MERMFSDKSISYYRINTNLFYLLSKRLIFCLALFFNYSVYCDAQQINFVLDQQLPHGTYDYIARDYIQMLPGFQYIPEAGTTHYFRASIDPSLIPFITYDPPVTEPRPLDPSLEVGTTPGQFIVDMIGRANYSVPILIPPGSNGFQPNIAIEYCSSTRKGLLGLNWDISGLSQISRTGPSIQFDGYTDGVTMTSTDRFSMDNDRLIVINNGIYGADESEYRTADESFQKITANGNINATGPEWFLVETKDGMKRYYGATPDSKVILPTNGGINSWLLSRIEDNQGNYILFNYKQRYNVAYIESIRYTGNENAGILPYNSIQFNYGKKSGAQGYDEIDISYLLGNEIINDLLLSDINIKTNGILSHSYKFEYSKSFTQMLTQIYEFTNLGVHYNSTVFIYQNDNVTYSQIEPVTIQETNTNFINADMNNDGRDDYINFQDCKGHPNSFLLGYWDNDFFYGAQKVYEYTYTEPTIIASDDNLLCGHIIGDFNGDGLKDIGLALRIASDGYLKPWRLHVLMNTGSDAFQEQPVEDNLYPNSYYAGDFSLPDINIGDFNGNGIDEILLTRQSGEGMLELTFIELPGSSYSRTLEYTSITGPVIKIGDFDGDNRSEIMILDDNGYTVYDPMQQSQPSTTLIPIMSGLEPDKTKTVLLGNFNRDNKTDLIYNNSNIMNKWELVISTGLNFISKVYRPPIGWPGNFWYGQASPIVCDFNGDGLSDVCDFGNNTTVPSEIVIAYTLGDDVYSMDTISLPPEMIGQPIKYLHIANLNGDGAMEFMYHENVINTNHDQPKQLISTILNGLNHKTSISYKCMPYQELTNPYTTWDFVALSTTPPVFPYYSAKEIFYLVDNVSVQNNEEPFIEKYRYFDPIINKRANKFLGFLKISKVLPKNEKIEYTRSINTQMDELFLDNIKTFQPDGDLLTDLVNTYQSSQTHEKVFFTYLSNQEIDNRLNNNDNLISKTFIYETADLLNGNLSKETIAYTSENVWQESKEQTYTYTTAGSWCPNKISSLQIKYSRPGENDIIKHHQFFYNLSGQNMGLLSKIVLNSDMPKPVQIDYLMYDDWGNRKVQNISGSDFETRQSKVEYDGLGRFVTKTYNALNQTNSFKHENIFGNITEHTDEKGLITKLTYDGFGRLTTTELPDLTKTTNSCHWDDINYINSSLFYVSSVKDGYGTTRQFYNSAGKVVGSSYQDFGGDDAIIQNNFDAYDNLISLSEPFHPNTPPAYLQWTNYTYDELNRIDLIESPVLNISYDYTLNDITITDNALTPPRADTYSYSASGKLLSKQEPLNNIDYHYNSEGKLINAKVNNEDHLIGYDDYGFKSSYADSDIGSTSYVNNTLGEVLQKTDPKENITNYSYDMLGRIVTENLVGGRNISYLYDQTPNSIGAVDQVSASDGITYDYVYDQLGRLSEEKQTISSNEFAFKYQYNQLGQISQITYPNLFTVNQHYNGYGYLDKIIRNSDNEELFTNEGQDIYGRPESYTYGNHVITTNSFDPVSHALSNSNVRSDQINSDLFDFTYTTSPALNLITGRRDNVRNLEETFVYDGFKRLTNVNGTGGVPSAAYSFSEDGNILENPEATFTYDGMNAGTHAVTQIELKNNASIPVTQQNIKYTEFNKIESIREGDYNYTILYGPDNSRKKTELFQDNARLKTKLYINNFEQIIDIHDKKTENCYLFGPSGLFAIMQRTDGSGDKIQYVHKDNLGSIIGLSDDAGEIVPNSLNSYDAWGNRRDPLSWQPYTGQPPELPFDRGFCGHEHLPEFGLINMNGRCYDPKLGCFLSPDIFNQDPTNSQNYNRYSYCLNNPLNFVDLNGYQIEEVPNPFDPPNWIIPDYDEDDIYDEINHLTPIGYSILELDQENPTIAERNDNNNQANGGNSDSDEEINQDDDFEGYNWIAEGNEMDKPDDGGHPGGGRNSHNHSNHSNISSGIALIFIDAVAKKLEHIMYNSNTWFSLKKMKSYNTKTTNGNYYTGWKSGAKRISTGFKLFGYGLGLHNTYSINEKYQSNQIDQVTMFVEQFSNLFSTFGSTYGAAWGLGFEAGKEWGPSTWWGDPNVGWWNKLE
jgi:RHS repeat-associated protein